MKMYKHIYWLSVLFFASGLVAQDRWQEILMEKPTAEFRMHAALFQIGQYQAHSRQGAQEKIAAMDMLNRADGKINVEIVMGEDLDIEIDREFLARLNIEVANTWRNRSSCWLDAAQLLTIAKRLPEDYVMLPVFNEPEADNEGPGQINSDSYMAGGANGTGVRIAVLDSGFDTLSEAIVAGVVPAAYGANYDWVGSGLQASTRHGVGCLESAFDHAPGATYYLHRIGNTTDMGNAVDQAVADGVHIITHSISRYNTGWADNSGPACAAAQDAVDAGILFFTSAGNRNGTHWQGSWSDGNGNDWHQWSGTDEQNNFTIGPDGVARLRLQWNSSSFFDHYDLFLYDANTDVILASSSSVFGFEEVIWTNPSSVNTRSVYVAVQRGTLVGAKPTFELFNHDAGNTDFQYASNSSSTTSPSNTTSGNVISVGAVPWNQYNSPPGTTGILAGYSSRGPSNNGNQVLDIVSTTNTTSWAYGGGFSGTSCATPNAAGAAAAFWSGNGTLTATGVRQILLKKAELYNDWGGVGKDNLYGHGGIELYDYDFPTRYIYQSSGNIYGTSSRAYLNMQQADADAPNNALIVMLGGVYQQPPAGFVFSKPLTYISLIDDSRVE